MLVDESAEWRVEAQVQQGQLALSLSGHLNRRTATRLAAVARDAVPFAAQVVVDLAALESMDLAGVRALLRLESLVVSRGGTLTIRQPNQQLRRAFAMAGLGRLLQPTFTVVAPEQIPHEVAA